MPLVRNTPRYHLETVPSDFVEVFVAGVGIDFDDSLPEYPRLVVNMPFIMQVCKFARADSELD